MVEVVVLVVEPAVVVSVGEVPEVAAWMAAKWAAAALAAVSTAVVVVNREEEVWKVGVEEWQVVAGSAWAAMEAAEKAAGAAEEEEMGLVAEVAATAAVVGWMDSLQVAEVASPVVVV